MARMIPHRVVALLVAGTLWAGGCSYPAGTDLLPTTVEPITASSSSATTSTATAPPTFQTVVRRLPLDDLTEIAATIDGFLAEAPSHGDVAEELASLNRQTLEIRRILHDYEGDELSTIEDRLVGLQAIRQSLAERLTELGLELSQGKELGPLLDPLDLPELPAEGIAVEVVGATVLVGLDGVVLGHLAGYAIHYSSGLPGPIKLTDPFGGEFLFVAGAAGLVPFDGRLPLAHGAEYVVAERSSPDPDGSDAPLRTLVGDDWTYPLGSGQMLLASGRTTITNRAWVDNGEFVVPGTSVAIDAATGESIDLPDGCWIGAKYDETTYLVCRVDNAAGFPLDQVYVNTVGGDGLVPPPNSELAFPVGHWRWLLVSPDGSELLGQWSGECEIPTAFLLQTDGSGQIATITNEAYELAPASYALGWSEDGRAIAVLDGSGACKEPAEQPGVHIYAKDGTSTWLYDTGTAGTARLWQSLAAVAG